MLKVPGVLQAGLGLILLCSFGFGQVLMVGETHIQRYLGLQQWERYNPAWLLCESATDFVRYAIESGHVEGEFKRPFDPAEINDVHFTTSGAKRVGSRRLFRGSFTYRKQLLAGKMWAQNSQPYIGIPFLLADSSTGGFDLNGLHWHLDYTGMLLEEKLYWGLTLFYSVSQQYKTVFPRPKIDHRDIHVAAGLGSILDSRHPVGLTVGYFDYQEKILTTPYSLEQGKTPVFYKIRGLDNPLVFLGKTSEERLTSLRGWTVDLDLVYKPSYWFSTELKGGTEYASAQLVDGGGYPVQQGTWSSKRYYFDAGVRLSTKALAIKTVLVGEITPQNALHPDLDVKIYQSRRKCLHGGFEFMSQSASRWQLHSRIIGGSQSYIRTDFYNGILEYFPGSFLEVSAGSQCTLSQRLSGKIIIGGACFLPGQTVIYSERTDFYYNTIISRESSYYRTKKLIWWLEGIVDWNVTQNRKLVIESRFSIILPGKTNDSETERTNLHLSIALERIYDR